MSPLRRSLQARSLKTFSVVTNITMPTTVKRRIRVRYTPGPDGAMRGATTVKTYRRRRRISKPAASTVRQIVKQEISKNAEDKMVSLFQSQVHNSAIGSGDVYALLPAITQGTDSFQRIGESVRPKRLVVKFRAVLPHNYWGNIQTFTVPFEVRLMILKQKNVKSNGQLANVDTAHLLRPNFGSSTELSYDGSPQRHISPINTELFEVLMDRKFTLKPQDVQRTNLGTYPLLPNVVEITRVLKCPARLTFDDGNGTNANNYAPFAVVGYCKADGSIDTINTALQLDVMSTIHFEDT